MKTHSTFTTHSRTPKSARPPHSFTPSGNLFRAYNPDKHGPLDRRFGASVRNEIAKLISKAQNRRKYVPNVPLASHDRATHQEPNQAFIRDEIMAKVGALGVAVFDCILAGVSPSVLVGRVELGSPSLYRVKAVRREVGEVLAHMRKSFDNRDQGIFLAGGNE